ncbi:MAG: RNA polymerase sigma factor [Bacteroidales bacterium]|nr:RNA polymerase sigma factor [Bacteroidales bacterium]
MINSQYKTLKDEEIIGFIKNEGKHSLYDIIYARYYHKVRDKCYSLLKKKKLAEDFANDILAKAFEHIPGFKGKSSFSSWLYSITYNYCIDYLRNQKKLHYPEWNKENEIPEIIDEITEDLTEVNYNRLLELLELIHPEEKALILMKYQDNLSMKQISTALRITEDAAKMRLKRARTRLLYLYKSKYDTEN